MPVRQRKEVQEMLFAFDWEVTRGIEELERELWHDDHSGADQASG